MKSELKFRHEFKYRCSVAELEIIRQRIAVLMKSDVHTENGRYSVRSLYFDNYDNRCFYENENGTDARKKYRIRVYNADSSRIALEEKSKIHSMTHKESCLLTRKQFDSLVDGKDLLNIKTDNPLLNRFIYLAQTQQMKPTVIVEYDRIPYVCSNGNVRITFDTNIRSSYLFSQFFEKVIPGRQILPEGQHLLEVKYDELLPDYIKAALALDNLQQVTFSKYYLCRKKSLGGLL